MEKEKAYISFIYVSIVNLQILTIVKVVLCPHAVIYQPRYWVTRYPQEATLFWNLTKLLYPEAWMWTFLTFILIAVTLKFASVLGSKIGLDVGSEEVAMIPFRFFLN